jgi:hypothetical protein
MKQWLLKKYQKVHDSFTYQYFEYIHYCILYDKEFRPHIYNEIISAPDNKLPEIKKRIAREAIVVPYCSIKDCYRNHNKTLGLYKTCHLLEICALITSISQWTFLRKMKQAQALQMLLLGNATILLLSDIIIRFTKLKVEQDSFQNQHSQEFKKYSLLKKFTYPFLLISCIKFNSICALYILL